MTRSILVLRPEPGNSQTVERITKRGRIAVACPLFEVAALDWSPPNPAAFDALLFTSANPLRFGGEALERFRHLPVYAVGAATAEAARNAGFRIAKTGTDDAQSLVADLSGVRLLHLCGADVTQTGAPQANITRISVYESRQFVPPPSFDAAVAVGPVALLHSPRAAARFAALVDTSAASRSHISIAAISAKAASAAGPGWQKLAIAAEPRDDALLDAAEALLRNLRGS